MPGSWTLTVEDCVFEDSEGGAHEGGGIYCLGAGAAIVRGCHFLGLTSTGNRGALFAFSNFNQPYTPTGALQVEDSTFDDCPNRAVYSWALESTIRNSTFEDCSESDPFGAASAIRAIFRTTIEGSHFERCVDTPIHVDGASDATSVTELLGCTFVECSGFAGAATIDTRFATVEDNVFSDCEGTSVGAISFGYNGSNQDTIRRNVFHRIRSTGPFGAVYSFALNGEISNNTFVDCASSGSLGGSAVFATTFHGILEVERNIFAFNAGSGAVRLDGDFRESCNNYWSNDGDNANFPIGSTSFIANPEFCDEPAGDLTLQVTSPCLPPGPTGCGLVGARAEGCGAIHVDAESWGRLKSRYRADVR
jgi:hypothetical protein